MTTFSFDAQVTAALFDKTGAIFALGDGSVRFESGARSEVHDGAVLCACVHPSGEGIVTGGDDGKLVWSREGEAVPPERIRELRKLYPGTFTYCGCE